MILVSGQIYFLFKNKELIIIKKKKQIDLTSEYNYFHKNPMNN